jgi:hypothetical protein
MQAVDLQATQAITHDAAPALCDAPAAQPKTQKTRPPLRAGGKGLALAKPAQETRWRPAADQSGAGSGPPCPARQTSRAKSCSPVT